MSKVENFHSQSAIEKIQDMAEEARIAMLCTNLDVLPFSTCPMSTQQVDEDGAIWFLTGKDSDHTRDIQADERVQLIYTNHGSAAYLSLFGSAEVLYDRAKVEELWTPLAKTWFPGGKDDPNLTLIKVMPEEGHYWDTKDGKMISFLKMAASVVTGKTMDGGVQGDLEV